MAVKFSFEYNGNSPLGPIYRPVAKVTLKSPSSNKSIDIWMIIDTGADYTILPRLFSEKLGVSLEKDCFMDLTYGIGGEKVVYFLKGRVKAKIGDLERDIPLAFLDSSEVPALMGRLGFLETFDTQFLKSHLTVFSD